MLSRQSKQALGRLRMAKAQSPRAAREAVRGPLRLILPLAMAALLLFAFTPTASAEKAISGAGSGAGQTLSPEGVAIDFETGRVFVADTMNDRVEVFGPTGAFERVFGWGVKDGKNEFQVCTAGCREGIPGSGSGQFDAPRSIAVDNSPTSASRHSVYVVDDDNSRIEKFSPQGELELAFGSAGAGEGELSQVSSGHGISRILIGIGPAGTVYVADSLKAGGFTFYEPKFVRRLQKFTPSGTPIAPHIFFEEAEFAVSTFAVDSTGAFYTTLGRPLRKYDADGDLIREITPFEDFEDVGALALAVGPEDNLFAVSSETGSIVTVFEIDPVGDRLRRFGYASISAATTATAIAASPDPKAGGVYVGEGFGSLPTDGNRVVQIDLPPAGPLVFPKPCSTDPLGNVKATFNAEVNPEGKATTVRFEYVDQESFEDEGGFASPKTKVTAESESIGADFGLHKASIQATGLVPETAYRCRAIATNADAPGGNEGPEGTFLTREPFEILATSASGVGTEAATLNATVNPLGIPTDGYFEYVDDATYQADVAELGPGHGFDNAGRVPADPDELDFGAGEAPKGASTPLSGLASGTLYHFRIRVDNHLIPARVGPERTLRTFSPSASLPDNRAWEMVSPAQKNSADVGVPGIGFSNPEIVVPINAAATSGEAITYTSGTSFGDPEGAPAVNQYLSKRSAAGWAAENVSPFVSILHPLNDGLPYRGFSADLRFGAFVGGPPLTPEAQEGFENLYLRDDETGALQALTIEAPQTVPGTAFCSGYAGASADGTHAIFAGRGAMAGAPLGEGFNLYEWSAAKGLVLVSVFPDESPAPPDGGLVGVAKGTGFGAVGSNCTMNQAPIRHAISEDGSTIFWTYGGKYKSSDQPLFARIDGSETIQLDAKVAGEKNGGGGKFWAATGDGSKAFFTAPGKLTADAKAKGQFYRYDTESRSLIDLTPGTIAPEIEGVIGASEDGSYAYFVAKAALTGEEESPSHQKAKTGPGAHNLYVWHEGEGLRFIGALSEFDQYDWNTAPERFTARLTPDGRHLAFVSIEAQALSGYDNRISAGSGCQPFQLNKLNGDPHCPEAYLYDAEADTLTCASCNPSGSRPAGPAELPSWSNPYEGPRYLSDDGSRLFFESRDVLSAADQNGRRDVYEFEATGKGSCSAQSPTFDPASGGCISLISSGQSSDETYLLDASADGRDVFFTTRNPLVGWDTDENYDAYDARIGGGFPEPPILAPPCGGEACKPAPATPPGVSLPATSGFQGPGNPVQKPKPKKHQRKKHKRKSKHKAKMRNGRTGQERRAGR
jgi:hypothetical protein